MGNRFDEFAKSLARGTSRREALRQLGFGLAGLGLAALGLGKTAHAQSFGSKKGAFCIQACAGLGPSCKTACEACLGASNCFCASKSADKFTCCNCSSFICDASTGICV